MVTIALIILLILIRIVEFYLFMKKVSNVCYRYDWKHVNKNEMLLFEIMEHNYHLKRDWSAYNFLFMKGPSPLSMFLSLKPLTLRHQYNEEVINRIKKYEII